MKYFFRKVILNLIITIIGLVLFEIFLQHKVDFFWNNNNQQYQKQNFDIVFLGNSRAAHHFNPTIIDSILGSNSINLGFDNSSADYHVARLQQFIAFHQQYPKIIIWNIDLYTLGKSMGFDSKYFPRFLFQKSFFESLRHYDSAIISLPLTFLIKKQFFWWKRFAILRNFLVQQFDY